MSEDAEFVHSRIWDEDAEADNPFAAAACYCAGFDVYGELLGRIGWTEYLYLLFKENPPHPQQRLVLERLAVALAHPGPRDHSVRAAMNAGVGGSTHAACLIAALAVGAGGLGGAHEVALAMANWRQCATDLDAWLQRLDAPPATEQADIWPAMEHHAGFDPNGASCATPVRQTLACLAESDISIRVQWLQRHREKLEAAAGSPLAMSGLAAAALCDLEFDARQGEMLYLLLRLPGAAVHALEQEAYGYRRYPFFKNGLTLLDDPDTVAAAGSMPGRGA